MNSIRIHPVTAGLALVGVALFSVARGQQPQHVQPLTPEQREILSHMSIVYLEDGQGEQAKTIRFTGVNVQVVNGLGATNGYPTNPTLDDPGVTVTNGVGNLIVGYNEFGNSGAGYDRTGSHNLMVGSEHSASSYGGHAVGWRNTIAAPYASVSGGRQNTATGLWSSVSGGSNNTASDYQSSVAGGHRNEAKGGGSFVAGGSNNIADGGNSCIIGGSANEIGPSCPSAVIISGEGNLIDDTANYAAILGGQDNSILAPHATITGGVTNTIEPLGQFSSIGGGSGNRVSGNRCSIAGGQNNLAGGSGSSILGGNFNSAMGGVSSICGGEFNVTQGGASAINGGLSNVTTVQGFHATVSGGANRSGAGSDDWVAGSLHEDN